MKTSLLLIATAFALTACCHNPPAPPGDVTIGPVDVISVSKPVVQKCIDKIPPMPALTPVPTAGVDMQALARIKREQALISYANELRVLAAPCTKEQK